MRGGRGVKTGTGVFIAEADRVGITTDKAIHDPVYAGLPDSVVNFDRPAGLEFFCIKDAFAVGGPEPLFATKFIVAILHVFTGGEADTREIGIGEDKLTHTSTEVGDGAGVGLVVVNAVETGVAFEVLLLAIPAGRSEAVHPDVPGDEMDFDAAVLGVAHDATPEVDLFIDGHRLEDDEVVEHGLGDAASGDEFCLGLFGAVSVEGEGGAADVAQRGLGVVG